MDPIAQRREGTAIVLSFRRPPANAFNLRFVECFAALLDEIAASPPSGGVVITGSGGVFSGGVDFREAPLYGDDERMRMIDAINLCITTLYALPVPTVAALNGHAMGGAFVLALACDARVAARGPLRFALSEVNAGIPYPACPMEVVKAELEPQLRRRMVLHGAPVSGQEAHALSVIDELCDAGQLESRCVALAQELARLPGYAVIKRQLRAQCVRRMRRIIDEKSDPMRGQWVVGPTTPAADGRTPR